jgi:hypothetical protein
MVTALVLLMVYGGEALIGAALELSLPGFDIASGTLTLVDAATLSAIEGQTSPPRRDREVPGYPIENDLVTVPTVPRDVLAFFSSLDLVRKRDGTRLRALGTSARPLHVASTTFSQPAATIRLPYTTVILVEVRGPGGEPAGETEISLLADDATAEMKTNAAGAAAILVEPGEYGLGPTGRSGSHERIDVPVIDPPDYIAVVLSTLR